MKIEATEKEKTELDASELDFVEDKLVKTTNISLKHIRIARLLEVEVGTLRAVDL